MSYYVIEGDKKAVKPAQGVFFEAKDSKRIERMGGKPLGKSWKPGGTLFGTVPALFCQEGPLVTEKAWKTLAPILDGHVEAIALGPKAKGWLVLNVLTVADALDKKKSKLWMNGSMIYRVTKTVLRADGVPDAPIFRLAGVEISPFVAREDLKATIEKAKLKGWAFVAASGAARAKPEKAAPITRAKGDAKAVAAAWKRIDAWSKSTGVDLGLAKGASRAAIDAVEKAIGAPLPDEVVASLLVHDGQRSNAPAVGEWNLFGCKDIIREWKIWKKLLDDGTFDGSESSPRRGVKSAWWSGAWIPLTGDGAGDHLCADLDPDKGGAAGQVITMWHADARRNLVAKGWAAWLAELAGDLEKKRYALKDGTLVRA
jgi:cell wall assembly regulator SMI1